LTPEPRDEPQGDVESRIQPPRHAATTQDNAAVSSLTLEARAVLEKADQGGVPMYTTASLARIAEENGISVSPDMTPNEIIDELRQQN